MTESTYGAQLARQQEWEQTHTEPWHLERAVPDAYVLNPEGKWGEASWGEHIIGPMVHAASCTRFNPETPDTLPSLTWLEVQEHETRRRAGEPIAFCDCIAKYGTGWQAGRVRRTSRPARETTAEREERILNEARERDPNFSERVRAKRAARLANR
jgi:hypothetical protein